MRMCVHTCAVSTQRIPRHAIVKSCAKFDIYGFFFCGWGFFLCIDVCVRQAISIKNITRLSTVVGGGVRGAAAARQAEEEEEEGMQVISVL